MPLHLPISNTFLDVKRQIGDPLADDTLQQIIADHGPAEAKRLFDLLIGRIEMPVSELPTAAQEFLVKTNQLPAWADWEKIKLANDLFLDHGPKFLVFLYYRSLPILYSCANGAKVLVQTGRLSHQENDQHKIFARRIAETGQFMLEVMKPGSLRTGGSGIQAIQKIRLIHAAIRAFTPKEKWDVEAFGVPINQEDLVITLLTFSVVLTDALERFGIAEKKELVDGFLHAWKAIGSLLGIDDDLLPADVPAAQQLLETIMLRQSKTSEEGQLLTKALLEFAKDTLPERVHKFPTLLMFHLNGNELCSHLGVQTAPGCLGSFLPDFLKGAFKLSERLEDQVKEPLKDFVSMFGTLTSRAMVQYFDKFDGRKLHLPDRWMSEK